MRILMVGGGSGGHVTPLRAVAHKLKNLHENTEVHVVTDRRFAQQAQHIFQQDGDIKLHKIFAGKYRRYNGKSLLWHITHLPTLFKNIGDVFLTAIGILQSLVLMLKVRPQAVFSKGGFVAVPVCVVAHLFRVPIVIHDSDAHPGLSSRIVSKWANKIATGMPKELYSYDEQITRYTGIPVDEEYEPVSAEKRTEIKEELKLNLKRPLMLVTGGGTGAERLNQSIGEVTSELLGKNGWQIIHITGRGKAEDVIKKRDELPEDLQQYWRIEEFADLKPFTLAADVVLTRTGATAMQEFANAKKTVVTVPSRFLAGGHQLKNAELFEKAGAVRVVDEQQLETNPHLLVDVIETSLLDEKGQGSSKKNLYEKFSRPKASERLAEMVLEVVGENAGKK